MTTPYDDEDAEEQWFYFQSTGKRAEDKKLTIKGKTYFFNTDGEMLIGWVQENGDSWDEASSDDIKANSNTYYCGEDGARLESAWVLLSGKLNDAPSGRLFRADFRTLQMCQSL